MMSTRQVWECTLHEPYIVLGIYEPGGYVEFRAGDGCLYVASGVVAATCRCGATHILDVTGKPVPKAEVR